MRPLLESHPAQYDQFFRQWGQAAFPSENWEWWKAQGIAESNLVQSAVSPEGAIGIMQLMPLTARELGVDPHDPESNIRGGIKYDRQLWDLLRRVPDQNERRSLTFASYQAGIANISRAIAMAGALIWEEVAASLPDVTGLHARTTVAYVARINELMVNR